MTRTEERRVFAEACTGYGFEPVEQTADGVYCTGCHVVHKRPTKMYSNGGGECLCRYQVVRLYTPEEPA